MRSNKEITKDILLEIGACQLHSGFNYIIEIIDLLHEQYFQKDIKWIEIFTILSKRHSKTPAAVRRNVQYTLDHIRDSNVNFKKITYYLGYDNIEVGATLYHLYKNVLETEERIFNNNDYLQEITDENFYALIDIILKNRTSNKAS